MKRYSLLAIAGFILAFASCKKDGSNTQNGKIVGKWYVNKLSIKRQTISIGAITDTTYLSNNFTAGDYFQFNSDSTAVVSNDGTIFDVTGKSKASGNPSGGQLYYRSYLVKGSTLTLQVGFVPSCLGCAQPGPSTEGILQLDTHNLALEQVITDNGTTITTDTYYTKGN